MDYRPIIAVGQRTPFALYLEKLGMSVCVVGNISDVQGSVVSECEAIYWTMESVCNIQMRHTVRSLLHVIPADSVRILDFNLKEQDAFVTHNVVEFLKCCDLLKIDEREFIEVCKLMGLTSRHTFDNGFEMMGQFGIKTLILTHGTRGCHVFHGSNVSEKWGLMESGNYQSEETEAAFLASFYVASRQAGRLFTECHRMAFDYMKKQYEND